MSYPLLREELFVPAPGAKIPGWLHDFVLRVVISLVFLETGALLFGVSVCRLGRSLQLIISLIQQVFGFLRVALHVPLVGLLRVNYPLPGLPAEALCGGNIRMPGA